MRSLKSGERRKTSAKETTVCVSGFYFGSEIPDRELKKQGNRNSNGAEEEGKKARWKLALKEGPQSHRTFRQQLLTAAKPLRRKEGSHQSRGKAECEAGTRGMNGPQKPAARGQQGPRGQQGRRPGPRWNLSSHHGPVLRPKETETVGDSTDSSDSTIIC